MTILEKFKQISPVVKKAYEDGKTINLEDIAMFFELDNKDIFGMEAEGLVVAKAPYKAHAATLFRITKKGYLETI